VLQHRTSNYDTDLFTPLFDAIREETGAPAYAGSFDSPTDTAYRVIADHIRTLCFAIADGAEPSNEGRGYVLRRILRRAVRFGRQTLGKREPFFANLVPAVVKLMGDAFGELKDRQDHIAAVILDEENAFNRTLDHGIELFEKAAARGGTMVHAEDAFKLYDTHGFPIDLTRLMAEERGMTVDTAGFEKLMEEARERSRAGAGGADDPASRVTLGTEEIARLRERNIKPTDDTRKFTSPMITATVRAIWNGTDWDETTTAGHDRPEEAVAVVLDRTNLYAEQGGQVADTGTMRVAKEASPGVGVGSGGSFRVDAVRRCGEYIAHIGSCTKNEIRVGDTVEVRYDKRRRERTAANHTATHLLNLALREVVGPETDQKGSLVADDRLRFDFNAPKALTPEQTRRVQEIVRERIARDEEVHADEVPLELARSINGLRAVFGETYPDPVRVVSIGVPVADLAADPANDRWPSHSIELCGGTHAQRTGDLSAFAIIAEENVAKGVRRQVAVTGEQAERAELRAKELSAELAEADAMPDAALARAVHDLNHAVDAAEIPVPDKHALRERLASLTERAKAAGKAAAKAGREQAVDAARSIADAAEGEAIVAEMPGVGDDRAGLMSAMDAVTKKRPDAAAMLFGVNREDGKIAIAAKVPATLVERGLKAGDWVRAAAAACGGKGGGRPDAAQGGGTDPDKLEDAIDAARAFAAESLA
jgi:alanyl-tRNA synthetase